MATGTVAELYKMVRLENIDLTIQQFYVLLVLMEQVGAARVIGAAAPKHLGRKAKVYEMNFEVSFKFFSNSA